MTAPLRYGSPEWLSKLTPEMRPIARLGRIVIARMTNGELVKIIGGTPERPTCMPLQPHERTIIARTMSVMHGNNPLGMVSVGQTMKTTWVDWYNTSATLVQQEMFDSVTKKIDAAGAEGLPGGSQADIIDQYRFTYPSIYPALENYRDTGGRRALFATETKTYDDHPIAKPKPGGPIEMVGPNMVLHPGRFTYSDPAQSPTFKQWLDFVTKERSVQVLRTQVSESAISSVLSPYYTDYEFLVAKDVVWNPSIPGNPTWLPPGEDVQSYWGKPTGPAQPDWDALRRAGQWSLDFGKQITTLAVLLGVGYLLMKYAPPSTNVHGKAHA